jgi:hypothetical protein
MDWRWILEGETENSYSILVGKFVGKQTAYKTEM